MKVYFILHYIICLTSRTMYDLWWGGGWKTLVSPCFSFSSIKNNVWTYFSYMCIFPMFPAFAMYILSSLNDKMSLIHPNCIHKNFHIKIISRFHAILYKLCMFVHFSTYVCVCDECGAGFDEYTMANLWMIQEYIFYGLAPAVWSARICSLSLPTF